MSDFLFEIIEDDGTESTEEVDSNVDSWKVLIVDDEQSVHDVTKLALSRTTILGKKLNFISALSGQEGFEVLSHNADVAVIFLDVVMESADAGLVLAKRIREELKLENVQIILRTGQPGYAPEEDIISRYEINDYKTKSELTRDKLFTSLATALRSYSHLQALENSKLGLRSIIDASANLMKERSVHDFASGVLKQINALFRIRSDGMFCVSSKPHQAEKDCPSENINGFTVVATSDKYTKLYGQNLVDISQNKACDAAIDALKNKRHLIGGEVNSLYLTTPSGWEGVVVIEGMIELADLDQELLQVFCLNVALGLENAKFFSQLNRTAFYDDVTDLHNATGFVENAKVIAAQAKTTTTLFIIDIDYFHDIVESLGFEFCNKVLVALASNLKRVFSGNQLMARLYSDVFAVLVPDTHWNIRNLVKECSKPIMIGNSSLRLGVTLGEAHFDVDSEKFNIEMLMRHAKMALRVAKDCRRGAGQEFEEQFESDAQNRLNILGDLRAGLANNEFFLMLQPKNSMKSGEVVGYEALIRWNHPEKGLIPPNAFIPVAEQSGLYFDIDMYVFRSALKIVEDYPQITKPISVNISANSLHHSDFLIELKKIIRDSGCDISNIELEITENALVRSDMAIQHLNTLKDLGFMLCLDDFGAGYSSLAYLLKLPLDVIKIDRSFVSYISEDENALYVLKGMLQICQDLNKKVVVEGVETKEQVELLTQHGVDVAQGFYYYKPMPVEDILTKAL